MHIVCPDCNSRLVLTQTSLEPPDQDVIVPNCPMCGFNLMTPEVCELVSETRPNHIIATDA